MSYHEGERAVQSRAGVREQAEKVGRIIGGDIPALAAQFLAQQPIVVTATIGSGGDITASLLAGERGFAQALDPHTIRITPRAGHIAQVTADLASNPQIGLLAIDFATRRRMRVNGTAALLGDAIVVTTQEVYSNCPQYIHPRDSMAVTRDPHVQAGDVLTNEQRAFITRADTFFIASAHASAGADASHRGGEPGFVRVESPSHLWFPDYSGNNMFNTLGNLAIDPRAGLLFVDFATGETLQLNGRAVVAYDDPRGERVVDFEVTEVRSSTHPRNP